MSELATQPAPAETQAAERRSENWPLALGILIIGMFMSVLDVSIVNVAVPAIQKDFGAATEDIQWIVTAYSLMLGVIVPLSGWLGDRVGLNRAYLLSLLGFSVGSALCGFAWSLPSLVLFRVVQAVPGGLLPVITLTMVYRIVPKEKIGTAMGIYGLGVVFAPAVGPTLGGYLVEYQNWRLIFFINVPIGLAGAALAFFLLRKFPPMPVGRLDVWGFVTIASGLFALLLALSKGQDWGWGGYRVLMLIAASASLLALFVVIELTTERPLIDVRIFRKWQLTISLVLIFVLYLGFFAVVYYLPQFLQTGQHLTPLHTGLVLLPEAVAMGALMPIAGQLFDRIGPRVPATAGLLIAAFAAYLLSGITADLTQRNVVIWTWLTGIGTGLAIMPVMTAGLAVLPEENDGDGSTATNLMQRVGVALGLPMLTALANSLREQTMSDRGSLLPPNNPQSPAELRQMADQGVSGTFPLYERTHLSAMASSYSNVFLLIAVLSVLAALLALTLKAPSTGQADSQPAGQPPTGAPA
ncbi:MAG TPA: DHA2 family efflux MFS transporter permease subunit [Pseudonocardia sp.]|uniref:DHA2 family efflux MFS transporter permease subunit n=1 Tax=Pseudonocardia sp. TaxID=60912 RepID=UPI002F40B37F